MSDFLTTLVTRSLHPSTSVRPQLLSLFEPALENGGANFRASHEPELHHQEQRPQQQVDRVAQIESLWGGTRAEEERAAVEISETLRSRPDQGSAPIPIRPKPEARTNPIGASRRQISTTADSKVQNGKEHPPRSSELQQTKPPKQPTELEAAKPTTETPQKFGKPTVNPQERPVRFPTPARNVQSARPRSVVRALQTRAEPTASRPAEQSINVTIGRVEVRATLPPPARSQPARTPAPIMSLDEYLRQRAGGQRA